MPAKRLVTLVICLSTLFGPTYSANAHYSHTGWQQWWSGGPNPPSFSTIPLGPGPPTTPTVTISSVTSQTSGQQPATGTATASSILPTSSSPPSTGGIALGFNYDASVDFATQFATAKNLVGTSGGFTSARLYTMIEPNTTNSPITAIEAAIDTGTTLLLGLFCSQGDANFSLETQALDTAITQYGTPFMDLIVGISVGSEDLYRYSVPTDGVGDTPGNINKYIAQTREVLAKHSVTKMVGHVDTYGVWFNDTLGGPAVLPNVDFIGVDAYPYWQSSTPADALDTFNAAIAQVSQVAGKTPIWITETGWPVNGTAEGPAIPSIKNAQSYWQDVGCSLFGKMNTWYYTLNDYGLTSGGPSFGVTDTPSDTCPWFPLTCPGSNSPPSSESCTYLTALPSTSIGVTGIASSVTGSVTGSATSSAASSSASV